MLAGIAFSLVPGTDTALALAINVAAGLVKGLSATGAMARGKPVALVLGMAWAGVTAKVVVEAKLEVTGSVVGLVKVMVWGMVLAVVSNVAVGTNNAALGLNLTTLAPILLVTEKVLGVMPMTSGWAIVPAMKGVRLELSLATVMEELALCVIVGVIIEQANISVWKQGGRRIKLLS